MPQDRPIPGSARDWLRRAQGDLALAAAPLPDGAFHEDLCYHAHQPAEKALKAVHRHYAWTFRYVHDLEELITGLVQKGVSVSEEIKESVVLNSYAIEARYPGVGEPVTEAEYRRALELARAVLSWAETVLGGDDDGGSK
ncbi:MAG: HEPN domain-containing protein [bacterium]|nr:HEPN domain-containing protein [bacterium]